MNVKKNEMGLVEEKEGRSRLDAAFRQSQNKTYEMEDRIRRCEDGIKVRVISLAKRNGASYWLIETQTRAKGN